jgi:hypothetical protein
MADRSDAELAQIFARQPAQNLPVNVVVAERRPVLLEPEPTQPNRDIHFFCPGSSRPLDQYRRVRPILRRAEATAKDLW